MKPSLTPAELADALRGGFAWLELNSALLDRLNVFPVPDGDTGSNMTSTFAAGVETLGDDDAPLPASIAALGESFNTELTRCSRGNSGFILARFFHGFFETAGTCDALDARCLADAVANGSFHVNGALFNPVEGTMISIITALVHSLADYRGLDVAESLALAVAAGTEALFHTPEQLPILARAGVIDSGALGLLCIFRGMLAAMEGRQAMVEAEDDYRFEPNPDAGDDEGEKIAYRYCTEAVVNRSGAEDEGLRDWLKSMGDSIALVKDQNLIKLHIHTNEPKAVFARLEESGKLEHTKVDDMEEQSRLVSADHGDSTSKTVLAFVPGEGFERIFEDFGVENCFLYGEVLPSPEEIGRALDDISQKHVIILPNNSNILPSVMAARELTSKMVSIIPTRSVIQGITACYGYSEEENATLNVENMSEFLDDAVALSVYRSAKDTAFGDRQLKEGDWFTTRGDDIMGVGTDPFSAVTEALDTLDTDEVEEAAVYHGDGFDPRQLEAVVAAMRNSLPGANVEHHFGGQRRAALIISLE